MATHSTSDKIATDSTPSQTATSGQITTDHPTGYDANMATHSTSNQTATSGQITTDIISDEIMIDEDESSSNYSSGSEYSTETLLSSAFAYVYENGRRYHAHEYGNYSMPNDEREQDRLDIMHHLYLLMCDGALHLAPIGKNPQRILDIGTGTGIWAMDMAERYPSAQVIGTDLSPIQPNWVLPNVEFQIDNAEDEWTWAADSFDYIHIRGLTGPISDWLRLVKQAYKCIKPGGFLEIQEYDMNLFSDDHTYKNTSSLPRFYEIVHEAAKKTGQNYTVAPLKSYLENAGFEGINYQMVKIPLGTWPADPKQKELGGYLLLNAETAYEAVGLSLMTRVMGMHPDEVENIVKGCLKESRNRKIHTYSKQHLFYAQKPCH